MRGPLFRGVAMIAALALAGPPPSFAQTADAPAQTATVQFPAEQLDALLAPIALYPDSLLVQILMASTYPLQVVEASRWLDEPGNRGLQGDTLAQALDGQAWDPSVKSLVPFPQVLAMLNSQLEWMQQLGWAFAGQQADVMAAIQRLRHQAQANRSLQSTQQQHVAEGDGTITIEPASPQVVYVPVYTPQAAYGEWPTPAYPPVYMPPPADYALDSALYGGLGFAAGVVVVGSLFGFAHPRWHHREVHLDVDRFNRLNANRFAIQSQVCTAGTGGAAHGGDPCGGAAERGGAADADGAAGAAGGAAAGGALGPADAAGRPFAGLSGVSASTAGHAPAGRRAAPRRRAAARRLPAASRLTPRSLCPAMLCPPHNGRRTAWRLE
jgi:hypothetical protein